MWWQSRSAKKRQTELQDFRQSLEPGTEVVSIGGVIGKVVSLDTKYEEIVIDSDGSLVRFTLSSISKVYERPAFIDDDQVDDTADDDAADDGTVVDDADDDVEVEVVDEAAPQLDTVDDHETDVADETIAIEAIDDVTVPATDTNATDTAVAETATSNQQDSTVLR